MKSRLMSCALTATLLIPTVASAAWKEHPAAVQTGDSNVGAVKPDYPRQTCRVI